MRSACVPREARTHVRHSRASLRSVRESNPCLEDCSLASCHWTTGSWVNRVWKADDLAGVHREPRRAGQEHDPCRVVVDERQDRPVWA